MRLRRASIGNLTTDDIGRLWRESPALAAMRSGPTCSGLVPDKSPSGEGYAPVPRSGPSLALFVEP